MDQLHMEATDIWWSPYGVQVPIQSPSGVQPECVEECKVHDGNADQCISTPINITKKTQEIKES